MTALLPLSASDEPSTDCTPAWAELRTRAAFDAALFYGEVLRWDHRPPEHYRLRWEDD